MAVLSFFGICLISAITVLNAQEQQQSLESICDAFPQLQICSALQQPLAPSPATPSSSLPSDAKNEVIKPMGGYKASVLAKAFEPHRPSYMRFGKRDLGDELTPHAPGVYKKFGGKQKSSYMRFGKRSDVFNMINNQ